MLKQVGNIAPEQILVNKAEYEKLLFDFNDLTRQLEELKRIIYGRKSERHLSSPEKSA